MGGDARAIFEGLAERRHAPMLRGIAGAPSQNVPLAGGLIAFALLSHSLRPAVAGSAREVHALAHGARAAFDARYRR